MKFCIEKQQYQGQFCNMKPQNFRVLYSEIKVTSLCSSVYETWTLIGLQWMSSVQCCPSDVFSSVLSFVQGNLCAEPFSLTAVDVFSSVLSFVQGNLCVEPFSLKAVDVFSFVFLSDNIYKTVRPKKCNFLAWYENWRLKLNEIFSIKMLSIFFLAPSN